MTYIALTYIHMGMSTLRKWRNAQNPKVSQAQLAEMLATTQSHISEIESAEEKVSLEVAGRIFMATGLRVGKMKSATDQQARAIAEVSAR